MERLNRRHRRRAVDAIQRAGVVAELVQSALHALHVVAGHAGAQDARGCAFIHRLGRGRDGAARVNRGAAVQRLDRVLAADAVGRKPIARLEAANRAFRRRAIHAVRLARQVAQRNQLRLHALHVVALHAQRQLALAHAVGLRRFLRADCAFGEEALAGVCAQHAVSGQAVLLLEGKNRRLRRCAVLPVGDAGQVAQRRQTVLRVQHILPTHALAERAGRDAIGDVVQIRGGLGRNHRLGDVAIAVEVAFQLDERVLARLAVHRQPGRLLERHDRLERGLPEHTVHLGDGEAQVLQCLLQYPHARAAGRVLQFAVIALEQPRRGRRGGRRIAVNVNARLLFQQSDRRGTGDTVHRQAVRLLERAHRRLRAAAEAAVHRAGVVAQLRQGLLQAAHTVALVVLLQFQGCRAACDDQRQHQHQRQHTHDALFHSIPLQMFQSTCGYCIRKSRNCKELLRICYKLNFSNSSIGWAISTFAPLSSSSCAVRKPHSTPTGFMPALHAQVMSTFVSPR